MTTVKYSFLECMKIRVKCLKYMKLVEFDTKITNE
jgi:hypothetical protein